MIPIISIKYNKFLDPIFIAYIKSLSKYKDWEVPAKEIIDAQVIMYKREWEKYGGKILEGMCQTTGLNFKRNWIDVFVVSGNPRPFSRPLVLKSRYSGTEFINFLTHELIHCLFADYDDVKGFNPAYPHENVTVSKHVIIHAILKYVLLDVLDKPEYLAADIANCTKYPELGYHEAWNIVEKVGYMKIIEDFKENVVVKLG